MHLFLRGGNAARRISVVLYVETARILLLIVVALSLLFLGRAHAEDVPILGYGWSTLQPVDWGNACFSSPAEACRYQMDHGYSGLTLTGVSAPQIPVSAWAGMECPTQSPVATARNSALQSQGGRALLEVVCYATGDSGNITWNQYGHAVCPDGYSIAENAVGGMVCRKPGEDHISDLGPVCCSASPSVGDPINPSIGNSYQVETDYKSADGFLDFSRYYNSYGGSPSGAFGVHWLHSFEGYIEVANGTKADDGSIAPTDVNLVSNTGRIVRFTLNAGVWLSNVEAGLALFKDSDGWTLGRKSGVSEKYDVNGRLVAVFDREGNRKELHYRMEGLLERVVDQKGREIKFTYRKIVNSDYFISRVEFSDGSSVSYDYDNHGNLIKSKYSDGFQRLYHYGEDDHISSGGSTSKWKFSAMTGISEADLSVSETRLADFHYDGLGRATATSLSGGVEAFSIQYDDDGLGATITSPLMSSARYGYVKVKAGRKISSASVADIACSSCFASVEYDQYGMMGKSVDFLGGQTYYTNDERGLETSRTIAVNDTSGRKKKIKTTWHASFAVPTQRQVYNAADVLVAQSSWAYNVRGQALTASRTDPVAGTTRTSTTTYCEQSDIDAGNCPLLGPD
ncbi:DUF6531 domain-containing protein [Xanthomonas translucens]|nr:DUF6531 domain-containing protein [Xanthomonas translucens]UII61443.1 DUF6531 domain-containing protein [Xanthomonas translucens]